MQLLLDKNNYFIVMGMGKEPTSRLSSDGTPKTLPTGEPTFSVGGITLKENGEGQEKSVTVHSCKKQKLAVGKRYKTSGFLWAIPWANRSGFVNLSVICEELIPMDTSEGLPTRPYGGKRG